MRLSKLLNGITSYSSKDIPDQEIEGLVYDSREVRPGFMFVALKGCTQDGHAFIKDAINKGAVTVVGESFKRESGVYENVNVVQVADSRKALSKLAENFYGNPSKGLNLIGITGTNGKTTTSYLLESILLASGAKPGVIGTINYRSPEQKWEAHVTTPESLELMQTLRRMADSGVTDVVMEVSSHALDQGRVEGCPFRIAVFTNISRDHLDYHGSMQEYFEAKSRLFRGLRKNGTGDKARSVINGDDPKGKDLEKLTDVPVVTYGLGRGCDVRASLIQSTRTGLTATLVTPADEMEIRSSLIGDFNIYNILAASAAAMCMDIEPNAIVSGIAQLKGVPGRLELVENRRSLTVLVDYAHTPDALKKALIAIKSLVEKGRLITVFGCGGDRDKGKRREMGYAAGEHSDVVFITSDNPRSEDPAVIISQIEEGIQESGLKKLEDLSGGRPPGPGYILDPDRRNAIRKAVEMADKTDLILIAGKGHEDYQIIGKDKRHFDDREVAVEAASR
ncbi:MAG: UDP-N-acetylmuramoyl-L-alanyl-D-glutamate--2,6-diaminopimelate ligase [Deltaproteobacteria bacterium]|nr:UDP-N-acetylmuramoyl-L-alanyl-D-glutamate--2,6-diaminopimelate ligase [Deltaproteobacteria bacterium]